MEFGESLSRTSNLKYVWHKIRAMSNKYHIGKRRQTHITQMILIQFRNKLTILARHGVMYVRLNLISIFFHLKPELCSPFLVEELIQIINFTKSKSSPGLDGIDYRVLKILLVSSYLFNEILRSGIFPKEWKKFSVFFFHS